MRVSRAGSELVTHLSYESGEVEHDHFEDGKVKRSHQDLGKVLHQRKAGRYGVVVIDILFRIIG